MSARLLGGIDIIGGLLLILSRNYYPRLTYVFLIIGIALVAKGLYSMV